MTATLDQRLQEFVGRRTAPPLRGRDPVNQPMIRHWCDAVGDGNPVYTDPDAAAASRHGGIIAPPAMLQAWTMRGLARDSRPPGEYVIGQVFALLDQAGFTSVVATNSEQTYARPLRLGDHLTVSGVIESVSGEKRTGLGVGHFVTWVDTYRTDDGEVVGSMRFRVLKFRPQPSEPAPAPTPGRRPRPAVSDDTRFFWEGLQRGELLIQRCAACGELRHPPRPMCPNCRSLDWDAVHASGRGTVHSYVVPHHPRLDAFPERYVVALIDLEEGTRLVTNLIDVEPEAVRIGMPVELVVSKVDDELTLPLFRPAGP
ncbi:MAG TPA: bifunctional MaoC family dehydratase N-terminal/OB-fold nucleic acid binding domain-containing protein [Candidatus Dormibacteraeota bacterium]|nr:bifunctional MaoC family dehydratase N-terminal/OB-fold nucleic acid binding domain-containing protein [Candidatus Dormibacteraeota bacterium]